VNTFASVDNTVDQRDAGVVGLSALPAVTDEQLELLEIEEMPTQLNDLADYSHGTDTPGYLPGMADKIR